MSDDMDHSIDDESTNPDWDVPGLFIAALVAALIAGVVGFFLLTADGDPGTSWSSSATHWWGLAVIGIGGAVASGFALIGIIAKGVEIGLRSSRGRVSGDAAHRPIR